MIASQEIAVRRGDHNIAGEGSEMAEDSCAKWSHADPGSIAQFEILIQTPVE